MYLRRKINPPSHGHDEAMKERWLEKPHDNVHGLEYRRCSAQLSGSASEDRSWEAGSNLVLQKYP